MGAKEPTHPYMAAGGLGGAPCASSRGRRPPGLEAHLYIARLYMAAGGLGGGPRAQVPGGAGPRSAIAHWGRLRRVRVPGCVSASSQEHGEIIYIYIYFVPEGRPR